MLRKILAEPALYGMVPGHTTETIRKELPGMCSYHSIESGELQGRYLQKFKNVNLSHGFLIYTNSLVL